MDNRDFYTILEQELPEEEVEREPKKIESIRVARGFFFFEK